MKNLPVLSQDHHLVNCQDVVYQILPENITEQTINVHEILNLIRRKILLILLPILIIFPIVAMNIYIQEQVYQAVSTILIDDINPKYLTDIQDIIAIDKSQDFFKTQLEIIKNRSIAEEVIDALQIHKRPRKEYNEIVKKIKYILHIPKIGIKKFEETFAKITDHITASPKAMSILPQQANYDPAEEYRQMVINQLQLAITAKQREGTKLVDIMVRGDDPQDAAKQANMVAQIYIRQNLEKKLDVSRKAVSWLTKEEAVLREKVRNAELALQDFRERNKIVSFDIEERQNIVLQNLVSLNSTYMNVQKERLEIQSKINNLKYLIHKDVEDIENFLDVIENNLIRDLRTKFLELKSQIANLRNILTERHPRMVAINSQMQEIKSHINNEIKKIINGMQINLNNLISKEENLNKMLNEQKNKVLNLNNDFITFNSLKNELEINRDLYLSVSKRLREAKLTEALETNNVKIVQHALVPSRPVPSRSILIMALSIVASFGLGVGMALVGDQLDQRFKSPQDVEQGLGIPLLGVIPHYRLRKRKNIRLIVLHEPWSVASEAYRSIRTWLQLSSPTAPRTILITSAVPGEGKSTTSANLAVAFAQLGKKVLLIDADLRRPAVHRIFHLTNRAGLADILAGKAEWQHVVQDSKIENLQIMLAGPIPTNPAELLSTGKIGNLLETLKDFFDIVICDSPVQLSIPDVAIIAPDMDAVLLVHRPSKVDKEKILEAKKLLERAGATVVGIVLNNVSKKDQKHHYSYYYGYSYYSPKIYKNSIEDQHSHANGSMLIESNIEKLDEFQKNPAKEKTILSITNIENENPEISMKIMEIFSYESDDQILLILDVEVINTYDREYMFSHEPICLLSIDRSYYNVLAKYFSERKSLNYEEYMTCGKYENSYKCDPMTVKLERGLGKEEYIDAKSRKSGLLAYWVPKETECYILTYIDGEIRLAIPFSRLSEVRR
jgi:capsular exopolysaccharide synthesis family protein